MYFYDETDDNVKSILARYLWDMVMVKNWSGETERNLKRS